jgi:hypothetical protein
MIIDIISYYQGTQFFTEKSGRNEVLISPYVKLVFRLVRQYLIYLDCSITIQFGSMFGSFFVAHDFLNVLPTGPHNFYNAQLAVENAQIILSYSLEQNTYEASSLVFGSDIWFSFVT